MDDLDPALLENVDGLAKRPNAELRKLGRLPYPMLRRKGEKGFARISWDEAYSLLADKLQDIDPKRLAFFVTSRGVTNEVYYVAQKVARFLGTNNVENAARLCHSPSTAAISRPASRTTGGARRPSSGFSGRAPWRPRGAASTGVSRGAVASGRDANTRTGSRHRFGLYT